MQANIPLQNWTKYPNNLLDNLNLFTPAEVKILNLMIRKTIGYSNPNHRFALSYIQDKTAMSKNTVITALNSLLDKKTIFIIGTEERGIKKYEINWNYSPVQKLNQCKNCTSTGSKIEPIIRKHIKDSNYVKDSNRIIEEFNKITGKNSKQVDSNRRMIIPRLKEGFTVSDFIKVFKVKNFQWKNDPKMKSYIRLSTLTAASHFNDYLNEYDDSAHNIKSKENERDFDKEFKNFQEERQNGYQEDRIPASSQEN